MTTLAESNAFDMRYAVSLPGSNETIFFEPISAGAVIGAIASLAASYASGQQLVALFAKQDSDIRDMIDAAVKRMAELVQAAVDAQTVLMCQGNIDACRGMLAEFENAPRHEDRLSHAVDESFTATKTLRLLGWKQFEAFGDAASVRVLALCVSTKHFLTRGDYKNLVMFVDASLEDLDRFIVKARSDMQALIDGVSEIRFTDIEHKSRCHHEGDYCVEWVVCKAYFYDNGVEHNVINITGNTEAAATARAAAELSGPHASVVQQRKNDLARVMAALQQGHDIRQSEWRRCCDLAGKFKFKA